MTETDEIIFSGAGIQGCSFRGPRANNEDWIGYRIYETAPLRMALVLCDGVGGSDRGEVASHYIVEATLNFFEDKASAKPDEEMFSRACAALAEGLDQMASERNIKGAATTWCLVYISEGTIMAGHLGDSRIHVFQENSLKYVSRDHSLVNDLLLAGMISEEEAVNHPQRNVITKAFQAGADHRAKGTVTFLPLLNDTRIMLCSDGFLPLYPDVFPANPASWDFGKLTEECRTSTITRDNVSVLLLVPNELPDVVLQPEISVQAEVSDLLHGSEIRREMEVDKVPNRRPKLWFWLWPVLLFIAAGITFWYLNTREPQTGKKPAGKISGKQKPVIPKRKNAKPAIISIPDQETTQMPTGNTDSDPAIQTSRKVIEKISLNMVMVSGGSFMMGCASGLAGNCPDEEKPEHSVSLTTFSISKYEVSQEEWVAVMGSNPSNFLRCPQCPVEQVSWEDAQLFISKLNALSGKHYRLPTEAEWEYAARGGNRTLKFDYSGGNDLTAVAWTGPNSGSKTHATGIKKPNELGIFDMTGNVQEWCNDFYSGDYYQNSPNKDPKGPMKGRTRVLRGASYDIMNTGGLLRLSFRAQKSPNYRFKNTGFRLAL